MAIQQRPNYRGRVRKEEPYKVNGEIRATHVRVVGEGIESAVVPILKALQMAENAELDLVEISPNVEPPICKIVDYSKFKYEQKKKQKELKSKAQKAVIKEIRFGPHTDDHDFDFKVKHAKKFLEEGAKVKAYVQFKGRTISYSEQGEVLLLKFAQALDGYAKVEQMPVLQGRRMSILFAPSKK